MCFVLFNIGLLGLLFRLVFILCLPRTIAFYMSTSGPPTILSKVYRFLSVLVSN
jgi:hypothetical protein